MVAPPTPALESSSVVVAVVVAVVASLALDVVRTRLCGPRRQRRGHEEWLEQRVTLARGQGKAFGARLVDTETEEIGLMIARISEEGALSEWNARNPSRSVAPGDVVVEVNGLTAPMAIIEEMINATKITMVVRRAPPGASDLVAECAANGMDENVKRTMFLLKRTVRACDIAVDSCAICMENVEADEPLVGLQCGHGFHKECMMQWLVRPGASGCPLCWCGRSSPPTRRRSAPVLLCSSREESQLCSTRVPPPLDIEDDSDEESTDLSQCDDGESTVSTRSDSELLLEEEESVHAEA